MSDRQNVSFEVRVEDQFGSRQITWREGSSEDVKQVLGHQAGQMLLSSFQNPASLRLLEDPRFAHLLPHTVRALNSGFPPALPPSPTIPVEPLYPVESWSPSPSELEVPNLAPDYLYQPPAYRPPSRWQLFLWRSWQSVKGDRALHILLAVFFLVSLATSGPISLRSLLLAGKNPLLTGLVVNLIDPLNPARHLINHFSKK